MLTQINLHVIRTYSDILREFMNALLGVAIQFEIGNSATGY